MTEYFIKAASVWFIGFFPLAEIYVAIPAGLGLGLDVWSVVVWSVSGNYLPAILISAMYDKLTRYPGINRWLTKFTSEKTRARMERNGIWTTLLLTPWLGVWVMAVTVKFFGMQTRPFLWASFISILVYALVLAGLISWGFENFQSAV
ncbi:MAG: small multi-drug export protein [Bacteroidales bacterium]